MMEIKKIHFHSNLAICGLAIIILAILVFVLAVQPNKDYSGGGRNSFSFLYNHFSDSGSASAPVVQDDEDGATTSSTTTAAAAASPPPSYIYNNNNNNPTHHLHPSPILQCTQNCSVLYKSEEKRKRAMGKLRDAIDEIMPWRRRMKDGGRLESLERRLAGARALIREAQASQQTEEYRPVHTSLVSGYDRPHDPAGHYVPDGKIYHNAFVFHRSYKLMEQMFKIFVYEEGEPPMFHDGPCKNIYSIEGLFINLLESSSSNNIRSSNSFRTRNPEEAHAFFLPFSVVMILEHLFHPNRDKAVLGRTVVDYVRVISNKYPYWNRSIGLDHFMLSCHDWGPRATWFHPLLYFHSIRVLCNANTSENFNPIKDASIPEINLPNGEITNLTTHSPPSRRTILGFFAGGMHGPIRPILLKHWKDKDKDLQIYEKLPSKAPSYQEMMTRSKYCICPSGYEVASPRIVEAIYAGCVPVLISQNYVLPFSDVLDWDAFSVQVSVSDVPRLKEILTGISKERYFEMWEGVRQVQRHFLINDPPQRFDVFHMIVHSIWLRRLNVRIHL